MTAGVFESTEALLGLMLCWKDPRGSESYCTHGYGL